MTASPPSTHHAPTAPAPAAAQDRSQQRKQLLDLAAEHAKLLSVLIADWAGDAGAAATPRDDGPAVRLPPIENRRPAPVDTGRHAHADLATPLPTSRPSRRRASTTRRRARRRSGAAASRSRRKSHATPARPKTPPRPKKSPRPKYSPLEPKPARPAAVPAPRDAVRRRLRADVAARLRASRASSSDLRVVELAGDDEPLTSPLVLRPGPPAAFVERSALVAPAPADEGPPTPATVVTPPSSVDAEGWDPPTPEIPPRTALVAPMPLATKQTALVAPAPVVAHPAAVAPAPFVRAKPEPSGHRGLPEGGRGAARANARPRDSQLCPPALCNVLHFASELGDCMSVSARRRPRRRFHVKSSHGFCAFDLDLTFAAYPAQRTLSHEPASAAAAARTLQRRPCAKIKAPRRLTWLQKAN